MVFFLQKEEEKEVQVEETVLKLSLKKLVVMCSLGSVKLVHEFAE
jgi:uncharacterized beta-barrel protein YwiB (DUF1934 family)